MLGRSVLLVMVFSLVSRPPLHSDPKDRLSV
jgi:hypothetical protein